MLIVIFKSWGWFALVYQHVHCDFYVLRLVFVGISQCSLWFFSLEVDFGWHITVFIVILNFRIEMCQDCRDLAQDLKKQWPLWCNSKHQPDDSNMTMNTAKHHVKSISKPKDYNEHCDIRFQINLKTYKSQWTLWYTSKNQPGGLKRTLNTVKYYSKWTSRL